MIKRMYFTDKMGKLLNKKDKRSMVRWCKMNNVSIINDGVLRSSFVIEKQFYDAYNKHKNKEHMNMKKLIDRLYKIVEPEDVIPTEIDRTEDGEFVMREFYPDMKRNEYTGQLVVNGKELEKIVVDGQQYIPSSNKKELGYFFNEQCDLRFKIKKSGGKESKKESIVAYYEGEDDGDKYYFDIDVKMEYTDERIKEELVKGFSNKFGWVELFDYCQEEKPKLEGVDVKFWAIFCYKNKRRVVEVNRLMFNQYIISEEESFKLGLTDNSMFEMPEYAKFADMCLEKAEAVFGDVGFDKDKCVAEFYNISKRDKEQCAFMKVNFLVI